MISECNSIWFGKKLLKWLFYAKFVSDNTMYWHQILRRKGNESIIRFKTICNNVISIYKVGKKLFAIFDSLLSEEDNDDSDIITQWRCNMSFSNTHSSVSSAKDIVWKECSLTSSVVSDFFHNVSFYICCHRYTPGANTDILTAVQHTLWSPLHQTYAEKLICKSTAFKLLHCTYI